MAITVLVMEGVMAALVAAVVFVGGMVTVEMATVDSMMKEAVLEEVGAIIIWAITTFSLQVLDLERQGTWEAEVLVLSVLEANIC